MSTFPLRIGTLDGLLFEGNVERVICRTVSGDLAILARHCNYCTALGMGEASVVMEDGSRRTAACAEVTWVAALYISRWKTGQKPTIPSKWKQNSSAM